MANTNAADDGASQQRNVEYILLAEFDIDRGAILKHQYPRPTGADDSHLAELMLPDGAHARESDWTMFFLNQKTPDESGKVAGDGPPLLYVLNLVRTKHDKEVRRGAIVKAMAVCTRHRFIHIYQAILMLALENYYRAPTVDTLAELYKSANQMDLSCMPQLSRHETTILRFSDDQNMFEERFLQLEKEKRLVDTLSRDADRLEALHDPALAEMTTSASEESFATARRGTAAESGRSRGPSARNKDRRFFDTEIVYSGVKLPIRVPMTVYPEEIGDFSLIQLLTTFSGALATPSGSKTTHPHLESSGQYTHPIILLMNGLLTQKRIIFLGHNKPAGEVSNYVLAAVALGSGGGGVLRGFANRAFPYTNLTNLDTLLSFPGYIAGVTNPAFEEHPEWWDLLCNINTGKVTVSPALAMPPGAGGQGKPQTDSLRRSLDSVSLSRNRSFSSREGKPDKWNNSDTEFVQDLMLAIERHYGEVAIRAKVENYVRHFMSLVPLYEYERNGSSQLGDPAHLAASDKTGVDGYAISPGDKETRDHELSFYQNRIEGFIGTQAYYNSLADYQSMQSSSVIRGIDIAHMVYCLRNSTNLDVNEVEAIYKRLDEQVVTDEQVTELLASLPQSQGGLQPLAYGFYHPSPAIRLYTVRLFQKIEGNQAGSRYVRKFHAMWGHSSAQFLEGRMVDQKVIDTPKYWYSPESRSYLGFWNFNIQGIEETTLLTLIDDVTGELAYRSFLAQGTKQEHIGFTVNLKIVKKNNTRATRLFFEATALQVTSRKVVIECMLYDTITGMLLLQAQAIFVFMPLVAIKSAKAEPKSIEDNYELSSSQALSENALYALGQVMSFLPHNTIVHKAGWLSNDSKHLRAVVDFGDNLSGPPIYVHGGILGTVLFNASALLFTRFTGIDAKSVDASERDINYHNGVPLECQNITIDATINEASSSQVTVFAKLVRQQKLFTTLKTTFTLPIPTTKL
ncbi:hypothetical protein IWW40_004799 [Coemansia sp. RSA 1250]|nr:hypothetical protein IWW40_004799 [Coemansia sp. RSA 1250]